MGLNDGEGSIGIYLDNSFRTFFDYRTCEKEEALESLWVQGGELALLFSFMVRI